MTCRKFNEEWEELLVAPVCDPSADVTRSLPEEARVHLSGCADCRRAFAEWRWLTEQMIMLDRPAPTGQFPNRVVASLKTDSRPIELYDRPSRSRMARWAIIAAPIAAAVVLSIWLAPWNKHGINNDSLATNQSNRDERDDEKQKQIDAINKAKAEYLWDMLQPDGKRSEPTDEEKAAQLAQLPILDTIRNSTDTLLNMTKGASEPVKEVGGSAVSAFSFLRVNVSANGERPST